MPEGCDVSEHQGDLPPEWFDQWDYCIIRAFNENGFGDVRFAQNWARAAGRTLRGVYGWPVPGGANAALGATLVAAAPDAEAGYWADVERSGRGLASPADVEDYLRGIGDHVRGFYSNIPECPRSPMLDGEHWWVADYGPNDGGRHDPDEQAPRPDRPYTIHQYTSNPLDRNYTPSLDWASPPPPAPPTPPATEELPTMAAALNYNGQLTSFYVNANGDLCEKWYDGSKWNGAVLGADKARVGAEISIIRGWDNAKDRLDLFVEADKGGVIHAWYVPGQAFKSEVL